MTMAHDELSATLRRQAIAAAEHLINTTADIIDHLKNGYTPNATDALLGGSALRDTVTLCAQLRALRAVGRKG